MDNPYKRVQMTEGTWAVICLGRPGGESSPDLATRSGFATREDAVHYAASINPSWRPRIAKLETP